MKTIGLIGGISWESTAVYYRLLNEMTRDRLGGFSSAQVLLHSINFAELEPHQVAGDWDAAAEIMVDAARRLEQGGAECLLIGANTMHLVAPQVASAVAIPVLHIVDATGRALADAGVKSPLLLATRYTMEKPFYREKLKQDYGIEPMIPGDADRDEVHRVIYEELCQGVICDSSRESYLEIIKKSVADGADGVIFGCTEVGLLLSVDDPPVPAFDTTGLHAQMALDFALN
ncbi:MAG: aspartate/glutamate racemase family protein [Pseudomonadota bacterium]